MMKCFNCNKILDGKNDIIYKIKIYKRSFLKVKPYRLFKKYFLCLECNHYHFND